MQTLLAELKKSLLAILALAILCCALYPALVWAIGQVCFPSQADGSLLKRGGQIAGSEILAQRFTGPKYFHPRPSCAGDGYDATSSGGSNLGPLSKKLTEDVAARVKSYREENGLRPDAPVPADAVEASGSGLDPHISQQNALLQAPRVATARGVPAEVVKQKVMAHTEERTLGFMGEPRVNVLLLNQTLDEGR
jgi:K+-transporting ATPase ATPase C chain